MIKLQHNSPEFIKSNIFRSADGTSAYLRSEDICAHLQSPAAKDEAFNEAIYFVNSILQKEGFDFDEVIDDQNFLIQEWKKND